MAVRRFGPVRGAGVQVEEKEGEKTIQPAALGFVGYGGIFEKGQVSELIIALNKTQFRKKLGGIIGDSLAPDAALDFYDGARGAGGCFFVRVTDGNELQSQAMLYMRNKTLTPMGTIKAKNGGRWGGKLDNYTDDVAAAGDILNTTLTTGVATWTTDQWKGGWIELDAVANTRYPIIGNTNTGVITVAADQKMKDDWTAAAAPTNLRYYLVLENEDKALSYRIRDGEEVAAGEFALDVYVDGGLVKSWGNLHTDPAHKRYWVSLINNDTGNDEVVVADLVTGAHVPSTRPANHWGEIVTVTATVLTAVIHEFAVTVSPSSADPTLTLGTTNDTMLAQKITLTFTGTGTTFDAVSDKFGALGSGTVATPFVANNKWTPGFTVAAGGTATALDDEAEIQYKPFFPDSLIDGLLYPDKPNATRVRFRITDNDHKTVTVAAGSDLTVDGAPADEFLVVAGLEMVSGRDGNADLVDADYNQQAWDVSDSPFNQFLGKNLGLVKLATPGINATAVQKAGAAYAEAKNYQYRYEAPANILTEAAADAYFNDTLGRNDFAVTTFPSYASVADPEAEGENKLKSVPLTGQIHGAEAAVARDYNGYHKAAAGTEVKLPKVLEIPTGETILDEEFLNPLGIGVVKKKLGNFILWGDRTLAVDPTWRWKHQRELMSHYEHVLQENFDWIVFAINDPIQQTDAIVALQAFFLPEWTPKRALRGNTFQEAAIIKVDSEINTDATRTAGDMFADLALLLADTVERFRIRIGKQGIFESVG